MEKCCLILDNDEGHAAQLSAFCTSIGFKTISTFSIAAAQREIISTSFDVAFIALDLVDGDGLSILRERGLDATEIMIMGDQDDPPRADQAIRQGASYFFCKPHEPDHLRPLLNDILQEPSNTPEELEDNELPCVVDQFGYLRGSSPRMRKLYRLLRKVAPTNVSLLVIGESGTGKELVARTVHELSARANGPFIAFNCASVTDSLIESELFGHEKGSFSGAEKRHRGFFERAAGGTLLLDEITEMNIELQSKLLRVLEQKKLRRVGSETDIELDVRVISATNRPPEQAVEDGYLREDLYYRLAQFPVTLPSLRERGADIAGLAQYFLNELNVQHNTELQFSKPALESIKQQSWPGNVRQLKHAVERAYIMSESVIEMAALGDSDAILAGKPVLEESIELSQGGTLAEYEKQIILAALETNAGDKKLTADELGISLKTLYNRLNAYHITSQQPPIQ